MLMGIQRPELYTRPTDESLNYQIMHKNDLLHGVYWHRFYFKSRFKAFSRLPVDCSNCTILKLRRYRQ